MTDDEWLAVRLLLTHTFVQTAANPFDVDTDAAFRMSLGDYDAAQVLAAIKRLQREGCRFVPPVADIISKIEDDPTLPTWVEVYDGICRMWTPARRLARARGDSSESAVHAAALDWLAESVHPWAAAFAAQYGMADLYVLPVNDPDYGLLERDRLRQRWEEWLERAHSRKAAGLPITAGAIRQQLGLRRFDPVVRVPAGEPPALERGDDDPVQ